jgi:NAD(P)-dependent dehydrogenase (short-subunit alcohol dehydrogenase family)
MQMALDGQVIVITGAARGYGRALLEGLLQEGARVVGMDIAWDDDAPTRELRERADALALTADVSDDAALDAALRATLQRFGTVDALVNNAALLQRLVFPSASPPGYAPVLESDVAAWERMLAVNVLGPVKVTRRFIRPMIERHRGSVVMISSGSALRGRAGDQPYGATKAAVTNLTSSLAAEVERFNVAVNAVVPATAVTTGYERPRTPRPTPTVPPAAGNWIPWRPEAMVPLVRHLVQQDAAGVTGQIIKVVEWNTANGLGGDEVWAATD